MDSHPDPYSHLARDPALAPLIERFGPLELGREPADFDAFASSIVGQQLSGKAAATIWGRLKAGVGSPERLEAVHLNGHSVESLRPYGLSRQKATYLLDLAEKTRAGEVEFNRFEEMPDDEIVAELTRVKGIGAWTVHMVLMFSLARPDVLPTEDVGIQEGMRILDGLDRRPKRLAMIARAEEWRPFRSYACRYLWKLKDA